MKLRRKLVLCIGATALFVAVTAIIYIPNWRWYGSERQIEFHLCQKTPLGSSEEEVIAYLRESGAPFDEPWHGRLPPNSDYPPNTVPGAGFIRALMGEYTIVFVTSVEAFYIFDSNRRLVEIAVRKTIDAF